MGSKKITDAQKRIQNQRHNGEKFSLVKKALRCTKIQVLEHLSVEILSQTSKINSYQLLP